MDQDVSEAAPSPTMFSTELRTCVTRARSGIKESACRYLPLKGRRTCTARMNKKGVTLQIDRAEKQELEEPVATEETEHVVSTEDDVDFLSSY